TFTRGATGTAPVPCSTRSGDPSLRSKRTPSGRPLLLCLVGPASRRSHPPFNSTAADHEARVATVWLLALLFGEKSLQPSLRVVNLSRRGSNRGPGGVHPARPGLLKTR